MWYLNICKLWMSLFVYEEQLVFTSQCGICLRICVHCEVAGLRYSSETRARLLSPWVGPKLFLNWGVSKEQGTVCLLTFSYAVGVTFLRDFRCKSDCAPWKAMSWLQFFCSTLEDDENLSQNKMGLSRSASSVLRKEWSLEAGDSLTVLLSVW